MAAPDSALERIPLVRSIAVTAGLGVLGVSWGLWVGSQMILLDGAYAIIGVAISLMLLAASRLAASEPGGHYPFGREGVTPLVIGVQGFVLLATLGYAAIEAVNVALDGGSDVEAGWATVYSVATAAISLGFWSWIRAQSPGSDLIQAEATAWRIGAFRSVGMVIGFAAIWFIDRRGFPDTAAYIDPAMVLVTCVVFAPAPLAMIRDTILELLEGEPPSRIRAPITDAASSICEQHGLTDPVLRMSKLGPKLYVEIEARAARDLTIETQHRIREELRTSLDTLPFDIWLNLDLRPRA